MVESEPLCMPVRFPGFSNTRSHSLAKPYSSSCAEPIRDDGQGAECSGRSHSALVLQILSRPALQPAKPVDIANGCPDSARADDVPIPKNSFPNISVSDGIFSTIPLLEHQFCNQYFTHPIRIVIYSRVTSSPPFCSAHSCWLPPVDGAESG